MLEYLHRILYVITGKKSKLLLIMLSFLSASLLDTVGIGLVGPFMGLATNPDIVLKNSSINWIYTQLNFNSSNQFIALVGLIIVIIFYAKSFVNFRMQEYIFKFSLGQTGELIKRLLNSYLSVDYTFHLQRNTAVLIQTLVVETGTFSSSVLIPLLVSISNAAVLLFLLFLLAWTSLVGTVVILSIILLTFTITNQFKGKMSLWGRESSDAQAEMIRVINHSLGGLKETRVIGCESYFENQIGIQAKRYAHGMGSVLVFGNLPRILIEAFLITFLVGFTSVFLTFNQNPQNLTSVLSIFAIASIRMLPAASAIVGSYTTIRSNKYIVDKLYLDLKEVENNTTTKKELAYSAYSNGLTRIKNNSELMSFNNQVILDRVAYRYPSSNSSSIQNISLVINKSQSIALIGKSGAGKTTLVDVILGLLKSESGSIKVDGVSIYEDLRSWQKLIGYIPQTIFLMDDTLEKNIAFGVPDDQIDSQKLSNAIEAAQLSQLVDDLPDGLKTVMGERGVRLSGGQRQRVGIARALYHEREILVLDEATAALDNETERLVNDSIRALSGKKTLIIIAHRLTTVEHCDCIYLMEKGHLVKSGTYQEVVLNG